VEVEALFKEAEEVLEVIVYQILIMRQNNLEETLLRKAN